MADPWAEFDDAPAPISHRPRARSTSVDETSGDDWSEFQDAPAPSTNVKAPAVKVSQPTGDVHDGDTFAMRNGGHARLYGVDAFELDQTGTRNGTVVPLGRDARDYLAGRVGPGNVVADTGSRTYGRPVVTVQAAGDDVGHDMVLSGNALPTLRYLATDPERRADYIAAQREAIGNERGAYGGEYQTPENYRRQGTSASRHGKIRMTAQQTEDYSALLRDPTTTPDRLAEWAKAQGHVMTNADNILSFMRHNPRAQISAYFQQPDVTGEAVLPNNHGGVERHLGALNEGLADLAGSPVDIVNSGLSLTGLPMSDRPVMGSNWIKDQMHNVGIGQFDEGFAPRSDVERYSQSFARGTGQAVIPIAGTMATGTRIAAAALPSVLEGGVVRQAVRNAMQEAALNPRVLIAGETGANVGSNVAGQVADDFAPGNPLAQAGARIVGGLAGGVGAGSLAGLRRVPEVGITSKVPHRITDPGDWDQFPDAPVDHPVVMAMKNEDVQPSPSISSPRQPDVIDVAGRTPRAVGQRMTDAQIAAASQRVEPNDVLPLTAGQADATTKIGAGDPAAAGNIRLENLSSPQDIKRALTETEKRIGFDAATRGRVSHEETAQLANDMGMTAEELIARRKGQAFNAEEALAARQVLAKSSNELVNLARRVKAMEDPGEEALAAFRQAWVRHVAIQEQVAGMTAEAGRTLSQFRMVADGRNVRGNVLNALSENGGGKDRLKDAADLILEHADNPRDLNRAAAKALQPKWLDKINELWINSLLSGPQTHVVNAISNTMTSLAQIPEHAIAAGIGGVRSVAQRQNISDRVLFSELGARSVGLMQGVKEGLKQAVRTARTGEGSDFANKVEAQTPDAISGVKGKIIRTPTRMLSASDELYKAMARRMELSGLAVRQASAEGLKGDAGRKRVAELLTHPTDDMLDKAFDYGRYITFQRPLSGAMQGLSRFTQQMPGMKFILPFVRTPTNLLKFSLERSPAAPLIDTWRKDFQAGGARRDLAAARAMVGTGVGALVMEMAAKGNITGNGPADDKARQLLQADGWQPYSVKVGDKYYSYSRLDPFATTFGVAAGMVEMQDHMTERQKDKVAMLLTASIMQNLSSKTWLSGIGDLTQAMDDPARYADAWWKRFAGSAAVPAGVAQVARTVDPALHEAETTLDAIRARVPGLSKSLPPRRDVWGQPIVREGGAGPDIISPAYLSTRKNDPVNKALLDANVHVSKPQRTWGGKDLKPKDYGAYHELSGALGKAAVMEIVSSPDWKAMDQEERQEAVDKAMRGARKQAREQMPDLFSVN